jgi:hypothetical protein
LRILPELSLGRKHLPWALARVRESTAVRPEGADHVCGSAWAKSAGACTCRGAGINAIARIRNVGGRSAAGRRHVGRPSTVRTPLPKRGTPKQRKRAAREPNPCPRLLKIQRLRRRVVTRLKVFYPSLMRSARLPRTARDLGSQLGTLLLSRLPSGGSQCPRP